MSGGDGAAGRADAHPAEITDRASRRGERALRHAARCSARSRRSRSSSSSTSSCSGWSRATRSRTSSAGRNLTAGAARGAARAVRARRLEARAVRPPTWSRRCSSTSAARTRPTSRSRARSGSRAWPTIALVGISTLLSTVFGVLIGIVAAWKRGSPHRLRRRRGSRWRRTSMPDFWLGMLLLVTLRGVARPVPGRRASTDPGSDATGIAKLLDQAHHMFLPALTLTLAYLGRVRDRHALVAARHDARGLPHARAREGAARRAWCATATRCRTRSCPSSR